MAEKAFLARQKFEDLKQDYNRAQDEFNQTRKILERIERNYPNSKVEYVCRTTISKYEELLRELDKMVSVYEEKEKAELACAPYDKSYLRSVWNDILE